ncbi:hypothetical protein TSAR_005818 [Trichomalopsis sarcophagae]|uniref:DNA-directed DNA polymerase n=1 Tax=Trichomalopsis sarcophagae TaxID=543379 RepID=A0A232FMD0_9HYME|nr:hypothetical protein TSAR_005818 [Trichomalopsis sarcophagae]
MNAVTCIAHKSQEFHAQFIFKHLIEKGCFPKFIALNDTKIMYIELSKGHQIRFIDSFNYINQNLSDFPKTFGFQDVIEKWRFPHLFNSSENQNYLGAIPDVKFYSPEIMSNKKRDKFIAWHTRLHRTNYRFDFQEEIVEYCKNNVEILRRGCYEFRQKFIKLTTVDPFIGKGIITIAGACHKFYRKKILQRNKIGIIPTGGYRAKLKRTRESLEWLLICERDIERTIMHIGHGHEYRLPELDVLVDGFDESTDPKTVYLYFDCSRNSCPTCQPILTPKHYKTKELKENIRNFGYQLEEMWSCRFKAIKANNETFLLNHDHLYSDALNPRDSFYDSRNENTVHFYSAKENEEIRFVDVNSLYPFLNKHRKYPVGHPKVKIGHDCDEYLDKKLFITQVEGLVKCRVLPPRKLLQPVLPIHSEDKYTLKFPLCKKCADASNACFCTHEYRGDREFTGTWVSEELKKAISMGYEITAIYEIWQYEVVEGLFGEYVNTFLKCKEEARGWHTEDDTTVKRHQYVEEYWKREGIRLDPEKMVNNKGLRRIAKHCLNVLWGKFGQKVRDTTNFGNSGNELIEIATSQYRELTNVVALNDYDYYYQWRYKEKYCKPSEKTSVPIAVYTTAYGRLELYKYLEKLGERVLYCDTDSVFYVQPTNKEEIIKTGKFLGEMINELNRYGKGSYIREFVSSGPKFYSYIVVKPDKSEETITKVGSVKLNSYNNDIFSHENMKKLAQGLLSSIEYESKETYPTEKHDVISRIVRKRVVKQSSKRFHADIDKSYPLGYKLSLLSIFKEYCFV